MKGTHVESDGNLRQKSVQSSSNSQKQKLRCTRPTPITLIGAAIIVVLCIHWHLALDHTRNIQPHDLFLSSFTSSSARRRNRPRIKPPQLGGASEQFTNEIRSIASSIDNNKVDPYITSSICGGCTRSLFDARPCWTIIQREQKKTGGTLLSAAIKLGNESDNCKLCNPQHCYNHYIMNNTSNNIDDERGVEVETSISEKAVHASKYWRFDKSNPKYTNPTTITFTSIPQELRIPPSKFEDIGTYFAEKYKQSKTHNTTMDYLVEYNPGIVVIPNKMKENLPPEAVYLLSMRVTPANNCFSTKVYEKLPKDVWNAVYHTATNHLGLALLDEDYQMVPGYDVIVEIEVPFDLKRGTDSKAGDAVSPTFMDYRIFILNNEIYLHANADTVAINRISLKAKGYGDDEAYVKNIDTCFRVAGEAGEQGNWDKPCRIDNLYGGDNLQVSLARQFNTIWSGGIYGKNYALFGIPNTTHPDAPDSVYAEIDIFPHHVQQILPEKWEQWSKVQVFEKLWKVGTHKQRRFKVDRVNMRAILDVGNASESLAIPLPSFSTVDAHEDWFPGQDAPFKESAHGGACCVSFSAGDLNLGGTKNNHHESLLVGIGHTKVTWKPWYSKASTPQWKKDRAPHTHYVALVYAFDPYPPFHIRARSGYFCLGHVPISDDRNELPQSEGGIFNPHSILTRNRNLQQNNITFDCPQMHFVSSFIEKASDSSKTIIGYGLNDCTGRLVEVEKKEIVRLLYPDPMDMLFEAA